MGPFELKLREFAAKSLDGAEKTVVGVVINVQARLIERSPVDTGNFRANWQYGAAEKPTGIIAAAGSTESPTPPPGPPNVADPAFGTVHYLANNTAYGPALERGHSKKAPQGVVGLTVMEFDTMLQEAAAKATT